MKQQTMLVSILCCIVLIACSKEVPSEPAVKPSAENSSTGAGVDAKYELMQQLKKFKADQRVYENVQVLAALEATRQTQTDWVQARDAHPQMKPLVDNANSLMSQAIQEDKGGDPVVARKLAVDAGTAKAMLEQAALNVPELMPINDARQAAQRAVEEAEIEAMKNIPEAKALAEQWLALSIAAQ